MNLSIFNSKLLKIISFLTGLFLLLFFIQIFVLKGIKQVNNGQVGKINKIVDHSIDTDVAIFGSSVAWVHFNPQIIKSLTGKDCYNFGIDGTALIQYRGVLKEFLTYSTSSTIVIVGTFDEFSERNSFYDLYKFIHHIENDNVYNGLKQIDYYYTWKLKHVPFYKLTAFDNLFYQHSYAGWKQLPIAEDLKEVNGFMPKDLTWQNHIQQDDTINTLISNKVVKLYKEVINEANKRGKNVILVLAPIYIEGQDKIQNLDDVRLTYNSLTNKKTTFLDLTQLPINLNKDLFYNNTHMNVKGANLLSKYLAIELNK